MFVACVRSKTGVSYPQTKQAEYKEDEAKLARRLLWFGLFLRRTDTITPEEKQEVEVRLQAFNQLLEQDEFVVQQRKLAKDEGKIEGSLEATRGIFVDLIAGRFSALKDLAQQFVLTCDRSDELRHLLTQVNTLSNEEEVRTVLQLQLQLQAGPVS